jgi:hypothetical protein
MGTYRIEWSCCGSVSETEAYEPESCPFCTDYAAPFRKNAARYLWLREHGDTNCTEKDGYGGQTLKTGEDLDTSVDKAMSAK